MFEIKKNIHSVFGRMYIPISFFLLLFSGTFSFPAVAGQKELVRLSSLDLSFVAQGTGQAQADKSPKGTSLSIGGQEFSNGVSTHADGFMRVELNGDTERFIAFVGVDDNVGTDASSVFFRVVGDGQTLFKSEIMRWKQSAQKIDLDVKGVKLLILLTESAGDGITADYGNWADAGFWVDGQHPVIVGPPQEEALVLTPKPPRTPRINGARIFGVRPGKPFLFTVPVTGDRPMSYAADGLPKGLVLDSKTGQITGKIEKSGEYNVILKAKNQLGKTTRKFKIVCGETLSLTPQMGWNAYYVWKRDVTDKIIREAADAMVSTGLINHGYQYICIDDFWSMYPQSKDSTLNGQPRDEQGYINANRHFPDMKALTDYIHSKGLKAGIYSSPGPLTCGGHVGSFGYEEQDAKRFADWGFDLLKYDQCSYQPADPNSLADLQKPYKLMGDILRKQDRDIVLNICQYGLGNVWEWGKEVGGHSWRTARDLGRGYQSIPMALFRDSFDVFALNKLHNYGGPGGWNDPDYLLLGDLSFRRGELVPTPLTPNEQYMHFSFWCIVAAPLFLSGDITHLNEFTLSLLTNNEMIDVNQDPLGKPGRRVAMNDECEVWVRELEDGSKAVGLFNRSEIEMKISANWTDLGLEGEQLVRDLWRQQDLGIYQNEFQATVPRHGAVVIKIKKI